MEKHTVNMDTEFDADQISGQFAAVSAFIDTFRLPWKRLTAEQRRTAIVNSAPESTIKKIQAIKLKLLDMDL